MIIKEVKIIRHPSRIGEDSIKIESNTGKKYYLSSDDLAGVLTFINQMCSFCEDTGKFQGEDCIECKNGN